MAHLQPFWLQNVPSVLPVWQGISLTSHHRDQEKDMTEEQIKHLVDRFLGWKLPENFNPDGGISFKKTFNEHTAYPMKHEPSGTNLLNATQADTMVRYMIEGMPR